MAHYLSEVTHIKLDQRPPLQENESTWSKQPPSTEWVSFVRAMEVATRGPDEQHGVGIWTADQEGTISIRTVKGDAVFSIEKKKEVHVSSLLSHGPYMWAGLSDGYLRIFDMKTYELCFERKQHSGRITCMISVGADVYTGSDDWQIYRWEAKTFEPVRQFSGHQCSVLCLAHDGGDVLFSGSEDFTIRCWDLEKGVEKVGGGWPARQHYDGVTALVIQEVFLFSASRDGTIKVWNTQTGDMVKFLDRRDGPITCLLKDPSSQRIWAGGTDGIISVYDAFSLKLVTRMKDHTGTYVKHLGLCVRLSALKVWSVDEDGIVKMWYADEDNEYSVYADRDAQLQEVVEDKRFQVIDNYRQIQELKKKVKRLEDIDERRKTGLAVAFDRKSQNATSAKYYNYVIRWLMKKRIEAKSRHIARHLFQNSKKGLLSVAYSKLVHYGWEQKEARRRINTSRLMAQHTAHEIQRAYWRNLLQHYRMKRMRAHKGTAAAALALQARSNVLDVYWLRWRRWEQKRHLLKKRTDIASAFLRSTQASQTGIYWSKLCDYAKREKERSQKKDAAALLLQQTKKGTVAVYYKQLANFREYKRARRGRFITTKILATTSQSELLRRYYEALAKFADKGGWESLNKRHKEAVTANDQMKHLMSMQGNYTDAQIDEELLQLEQQLKEIVQAEKDEKVATQAVLTKKGEKRRQIFRTTMNISPDSTMQEQIREVMNLLKAKSINCDHDFEHLCEAREEGKKMGPSKMYSDAVKRIKKVTASETVKRAKELGIDIGKDETCTEAGEWVMLDGIETWPRKSIRQAAIAVRDMIIAYDMMTVNPQALAKLEHNNQVITNAGLMLEVVDHVHKLRRKGKDDSERGSKRRRSRSGSKGGKKKSSKKKSADKKKKKIGEDGKEIVKKSTKKSSKKKGSTKKRSSLKKKSSKKKKQPLVPRAATAGTAASRLKKKSSKKSTKKKSTKKSGLSTKKKSVSKKKSSKKSGLKKKSSKKTGSSLVKKKSTKKKSTKKSLLKKKSTKKSGLKKKSSAKTGVKKVTKKKSTKTSTGLKKKSVSKKKSTKKKTGTKKSTKKKKKKVTKKKSSEHSTKKAKSPAKKPWLGMMIQVDNPSQVVLADVVPKGPAHSAGFGDNDVLIEFGGEPITDVASFQAAFKKHAKVGAEVKVKAYHDGDKRKVISSVLPVSSFAEKAKLVVSSPVSRATVEEDTPRAAVEPPAARPNLQIESPAPYVYQPVMPRSPGSTIEVNASELTPLHAEKPFPADALPEEPEEEAHDATMAVVEPAAAAAAEDAPHDDEVIEEAEADPAFDEDAEQQQDGDDFHDAEDRPEDDKDDTAAEDEKDDTAVEDEKDDTAVEDEKDDTVVESEKDDTVVEDKAEPAADDEERDEIVDV